MSSNANCSTINPPEPYRRYGSAWLRVHHFLYLFRLNQKLTAAVIDTNRESGVSPVTGETALSSASGGSATAVAAAGSPFLSWHVRHGDKVTEFHKTFQASDFVPTLDAVAQAAASAPIATAAPLSLSSAKMQPITSVFLASDDPAVTEQAPGLLRPKYSAYFLKDRMKLGNSAVAEAASVAKTSGDNAYALALDAISNLWMLSEGSYFVGAYFEIE